MSESESALRRRSKKKTLRQLDETLGCVVQRRRRTRASDEPKSDRHLCCAIFIFDVLCIRVCAMSNREGADMRGSNLDTARRRHP